VDQRAGAVAFDERAAQVRFLPTAHRVDEVGVVVADALEFLDEFAVAIEGLRERVVRRGNP
jgi:hypothetical protein